MLVVLELLVAARPGARRAGTWRNSSSRLLSSTATQSESTKMSSSVCSGDGAGRIGLHATQQKLQRGL
jgi:hypothetical protein